MMTDPIERMTRTYVACGDFTDNPEKCMLAAVHSLRAWFLEHANEDGPLGLGCLQGANAIKIIVLDQHESEGINDGS